MEKSGKRGKIPQSDWPLIMARYEQGETLSSIARTYDCSPPAISYIVSRSRGKPAPDVPSAATSEPQLVKNGAGTSLNGSAPLEPSNGAAAPPIAAALRRDAPPEPRSPAPTNGNTAGPGDQRRTLHLSLGGHGNGSQNHAAPNGNGLSAEPARQGLAAARPSQPPAAGERNGQPPFPAPPRVPNRPDPVQVGRDLFAVPDGRPAPQQPRDAEPLRKDTGVFIDQELRSRVDGDIAAFLAAFDAALAEDTQESRFGLREATDRLLRAGARTRIELERLEARVPLPPRDGGGAVDPAAWRHRSG